MTPFVDIKPGQWALAFDQPYFLPGSDMAEWLEKFVSRGGGWNVHEASEIFLVHRIETVKPKTYFAAGGARFPRENVVAAAEYENDAIELRKRFFAIGDEADDAIDFVVERLARPVRRRVYAKALKEIHKTLPHIFGGKS